MAAVIGKLRSEFAKLLMFAAFLSGKPLTAASVVESSRPLRVKAGNLGSSAALPAFQLL